MYKAQDISNYIIKYSRKNGFEITNSKLQNMLYLLQAYYLAKTGNPCFSDKIEAWSFGPVVPEVYKKYEQFEKESASFNSNAIAYVDKRNINAVVNAFAGFSSDILMQITQKNSPWESTYSSKKNKEISKEEIRKYFSKAK